ncbi:MAG: T9SS type A sorting domain-containing protein [Chitinophagales bacterium]
MRLLNCICLFCVETCFIQADAQIVKLQDFYSTPFGSTPKGGVVSDGTYYYGTASAGGDYDHGIIFKGSCNGESFEKVYSFEGGVFGWEPSGAIIYDGTRLYGMTTYGGSSGYGVVYSLLEDGTDYNVLHDFTGSDGQNPDGFIYNDGLYLYGTTPVGGANGKGVLFRIKLNGTAFEILHAFGSDITDGADPHAQGLASYGDWLYGQTDSGGIYGNGIVYKIRKDGADYSILYSFSDGEDARNPTGTPLFIDGIIYGTAGGGFYHNGAIYAIDSSGTYYTVLHNFEMIVDGASPTGLAFAHDRIYGVTNTGGDNGNGILFFMDVTGLFFLNIEYFNAPYTGAEPNGPLFFDGNCLYGLTRSGGNHNQGVSFAYCFATEIQIPDQSELINIEPNPAENQLTIHWTDAEPVTRSMLYDITGKVLIENELNGEQFLQMDISHLPAGWYLIRLYNGNKELGHAAWIKK